VRSFPWISGSHSAIVGLPLAETADAAFDGWLADLGRAHERSRMKGRVVILDEVQGRKAAALIVDGRLEDILIDAGR
jgi:hypothetical protein